MPKNYPSYFLCPYCNSKINTKSVWRMLMSYIASFPSEKKREASRLARNAIIRKTPSQEQIDKYVEHKKITVRNYHDARSDSETSAR